MYRHTECPRLEKVSQHSRFLTPGELAFARFAYRMK
jgi:hypothetical protein